MGIFDIFKSQPPLVAKALAESDIPQGSPPTEDYKDLPVASLGNWDVGTLKAALAGHQMGNFSQAAILTESMLGDGRVQSALNGRLKGLTMRQPRAYPAARDTAGKRAELCLKVWRRIFTDEFLDQSFSWATIMGFVVCEVTWELEDLDGEELWIPYLKVWHPLYVWYDIVKRQYVAITEGGNIYIDPKDPKWWVFTPWGSYRGWLRGALRACAPLWMIRQYALRDWARFSEVHGLPIRMIKAPAQSNAMDKTRMFSQVKNLGASSTVLLPQQTGPDGTGWALELLEAKDPAWQAFPGLIETCDREIQQVIRGTNLTSEVQGGSYAAAQVHADEDSGYAESDCRKLCDSAKRLFELFLGYNFGEGNLAPEMRLEAPEKPDLLALAQAQQFAMTWVKQARENGWKLDAQVVADKFTIPLMEVAEEADNQKAIPLAPTDIAKTVTANEVRRSIGLPDLGDERGDLLIAELESGEDGGEESAPDMAAKFRAAYNEKQERDDDGKFGSGPGDSDGGTKEERVSDAKSTVSSAKEDDAKRTAEAKEGLKKSKAELGDLKKKEEKLESELHSAIGEKKASQLDELDSTSFKRGELASQIKRIEDGEKPVSPDGIRVKNDMEGAKKRLGELDGKIDSLKSEIGEVSKEHLELRKEFHQASMDRHDAEQDVESATEVVKNGPKREKAFAELEAAIESGNRRKLERAEDKLADLIDDNAYEITSIKKLLDRNLSSQVHGDE